MDIPQRTSRKHRFTPAERWALLVEYDKCLDLGSKAAFRHKVGVAQSTVRQWLLARDQGRLKAPDEVQPPQRLRSSMSALERREFTRVQRENAAYKLKLEQTEATVDILKKASALLDSLAKSAVMPKIEVVPPTSEGWPAWLGPRTGLRP